MRVFSALLKTAPVVLAMLAGRPAAPAGEFQAPRDVPFKAKGDGSLQHYVEMLPGSFNRERPCDVLVVLHGHGSDRWQYVRTERGECKAARDFAARRGMILISPDYRAPASWMAPRAEADLVQIIAELRRKYRVGKVFLAGGSMGGTASLIFAALHPDLVAGVSSQNGTGNMLEYQGFARAVAAAYGGNRQTRREEYRKRSPELFPEKLKMPVAFTVGGRDTVVPPDSVRRLARQLRGRNEKNVLILDRKEGGHETSYEDTLRALEFIVQAAEPSVGNGK